jgi:hypothetical protein
MVLPDGGSYPDGAIARECQTGNSKSERNPKFEIRKMCDVAPLSIFVTSLRFQEFAFVSDFSGREICPRVGRIRKSAVAAWLWRRTP